MKKHFLRNVALAACLLASLVVIGTNAEAKDTAPDNDNCWYAGITVYCHSYWSTQCSDGTSDPSCGHLVLGPSNGWGAGGGSSAESCSTALHALMIDAAYAGCRIQEGSPNCYYEGGDCPDDGGDDDGGDEGG